MGDQPGRHERSRSSRQRFRNFVEDYRRRRLDEVAEADKNGKPAAEEALPGEDSSPKTKRRGKRREYLREYVRWLKPHRYAVGALMLLALGVAGLEMIEPLFMRFIVDRVLLNPE